MLASTRITANPTGTVRPVKLVRPTTGFGSSAISVQTIVQAAPGILQAGTPRPIARHSSICPSRWRRGLHSEARIGTRRKSVEAPHTEYLQYVYLQYRLHVHLDRKKSKVKDILLSRIETTRISPPRRDPCFCRPHRD